ncbi:MAG TPA: FAD-binding protein [Burkholderiaceae bacterium]
MNAPTHIVNDVTGLNPVPVWAVVTPRSEQDVVDALRRSTGPVSVGGGRFSMGGQTASPGSLHLDMREMNQVVAFSPAERTLRVQPGIRWRDIQRFIDPHELSVKIMQTYANFTVGGSVSVNVHGRYLGLGPLVLSLRSLRVVLADGTATACSREENPELFFGVVGGYGGLGVITEVELELAENFRVERVQRKMRTRDYLAHFRDHVRGDPGAVFHNADLYPPHFDRIRAVTWLRTERAATEPARLHEPDAKYPLERYFVWAVTETPLGKWRREFLIDPLLYARRKVHWRNFEASYDVAELEPKSRTHATYVLQEYFCPVDRFEDFVARMGEILRRHRVNALNVSVRHAFADPGTLMAWAPRESFAFVLYYKQRTRDNARNRVAVWTRELVDAAIAVGGSYYLPYQPHATPEQFHAAYPRAKELFALKGRLDPGFRLRNVLWDTYYAPTLAGPAEPAPERPAPASDFHAVFEDVDLHDGFYRFLQNVYRLYPEDRFHTLIKSACQQFSSEQDLYRHLQRELPGIKPALADLRLALPALAKQKREMARQALQLLGTRRRIDGTMEIGSTGRYVSELRKHLTFSGRLILLHDKPPTMSPVDIAERGRLAPLGEFLPIDDYAPLPDSIAPHSLDLVTCFIGLHHARPEALPPFLASIARVLRPGGLFILRDHDVRDERMRALVALAHTVFNAGLGEPWAVNENERRHFAPASHWADLLAGAGLVDQGARLAQAHDPTDNLLMAFVKPGAAA